MIQRTFFNLSSESKFSSLSVHPWVNCKQELLTPSLAYFNCAYCQSVKKSSYRQVAAISLTFWSHSKIILPVYIQEDMGTVREFFSTVKRKTKTNNRSSTCHSALFTPFTSTPWRLESFAGTVEMTLFWHCIFPSDIFCKPRRLQIYAYSDCGEDDDGFNSAVSRLPDPENLVTVYVHSVTPPALTTSPFLTTFLPVCRDVWARVHVWTSMYSQHWQIHVWDKEACDKRDWMWDDTKTILSCALAVTFF